MRIEIEVRVGGKRNRIAMIERDPRKTAEQGIGLQLAEVKSLIGRLQQIVATAQVDEVIERNCLCGQCGEPLPRKGSASIVYRTAFGKLRLDVRAIIRHASAAIVREKPRHLTRWRRV